MFTHINKCRFFLKKWLEIVLFYLNKSSFPFTIKPSKGRVHLFGNPQLDRVD